MESNIKIKATGKEINKAFNEEDKCFMIKHYQITNCDLSNISDDEIDNNKWVYDVLVRHKELHHKLDRKQPYTIKSMIEAIQKFNTTN